MGHSMSTDPKNWNRQPNISEFGQIYFVIFEKNFSYWLQRTKFFENQLRFHDVMVCTKWALLWSTMWNQHYEDNQLTSKSNYCDCACSIVMKF